MGLRGGYSGWTRVEKIVLILGTLILYGLFFYGLSQMQ